jgi:hypothetical protein
MIDLAGQSVREYLHEAVGIGDIPPVQCHLVFYVAKRFKSSQSVNQNARPPVHLAI